MTMSHELLILINSEALKSKGKMSCNQCHQLYDIYIRQVALLRYKVSISSMGNPIRHKCKQSRKSIAF